MKTRRIYRTARRDPNRVLYSVEQLEFDPMARRLCRVLRTGMKVLRLRHTQLSLVLVSDRFIRKLNKRYRRQDRSTDVLSFHIGEPTPQGKHTLGDVVISMGTARRQARVFGKTLVAECARLAVHGLLHLLGHDHQRPSESRRMFSLQDRLLRKVLNEEP